MSETETTSNQLNLKKIGSGSKAAFISFLIQPTLFGPAFSLSSLVFNPVVSGILCWLLIFYLNIYIVYKFSKSKLQLEHIHISSELDRQAVLHDYQLYLNVKRRLIRLMYIALIPLAIIFVFVAFRKSAAPLVPTAFIFISILATIFYYHLPQYIALYYLTHHHLDITPQGVEYEIEWHKQQLLDTQDLTEEISVTPETSPTIPIPKALDEIPTPPILAKTVQPPIESKKVLSEIELLLKTLRQQLTAISIMQLRSFHGLIEVLQYLETRRRTMPIVYRKELAIIIEKLTPEITKDIEHYFSYPEEQRIQYQSVPKMIPELWLKKQIESYTQQLIEQTKFVYERDLNSFTNHQKFLDQKFTPIEDFKTIVQRPYTPPPIKKKN